MSARPTHILNQSSCVDSDLESIRWIDREKRATEAAARPLARAWKKDIRSGNLRCQQIH
jgi:hypothetical protein